VLQNPMPMPMTKAAAAGHSNPLVGSRTASISEPITNAAWRDKPSWFIMGEQDYMLLIDLERDTAKRMGAKTLVLQSSHVPMISHPGEVADFVEKAANELS